MNILLVDDDAFLRDMYATKFRELGHTIDAAQTAENALAKLESGTYDVILMDMVMPGMNGIELLKEIKSKNLGGNPTCIMLSNQSDDADKEAALGNGAVGYIVKAEFIPSEVVEQVLKLVAK
ncbi:MAG TPA: response regulator [Candidatus Paceibacterota bacterium]|nr:response regulator [Candidatus Paceibacterota bacterium]